MSACFEQKDGTGRDRNKTDFAIELARRTNMPRAKALEVTSVMLSIMSEKLDEKEEIHFDGLGTFQVRYSPERPARNFRTGEPVMIPVRYKVIFKASPHLLEEIKDKQETK